MNNRLTVEIIVEGPTESKFVKTVLAPYWGKRGIDVYAPVIRTQIDERSGTIYKGGDIRFSRIKKQISNFLKQRDEIIVASFVDYYGIMEWPSLEAIQGNHSPHEIAHILNNAAKNAIQEAYPEMRPSERYFPFTAVYEFEALLISDSSILAKNLCISSTVIDAVLQEYGNPETINNSPETAPSKRLDAWTNGQYGKTTTGIVIAEEIGIDKMRQACPNFDAWLSSIEALQEEV
ncbi:MAG: DUF4276 family protein [Lentisphaerae bacterium]|nr:DUF4276 family protein [Lentisphaerota bacterium]